MNVSNLLSGSRLAYTRSTKLVGREAELRHLTTALFDGQNDTQASCPLIIAGPEGVGKTALAVELAYICADRLQGIHWIHASDADQIPAEIAACGTAMGLPSWPDRQPYQVERTLHAWRTGGPRLVILDGLNDPQTLELVFPVADLGPTRLLVITSDAEGAAQLDADLVHLAPLGRAETQAVLAGCRPDLAPDEIESLFNELGGLPLALHLAGKCLAVRPDLSISEYMNLLRDRHKTHTQHAPADDWLASIIETNCQALPGDRSRELFSYAAWCAPDYPLPVALLRCVVAGGGAEQNGTVAAFRRAVQSLLDLGLFMEGDSKIGPRLHTLIAAFGRQIDQNRVGLKGIAKAFLDLIDADSDSSSLQLVTRLAPHLRAVAQTAETANLATAGALWDRLSVHLQIIGAYADAQAAAARAVAAHGKTHGPRHERTGSSLVHLATAAQAQGDMDRAKATVGKALSILDRPDTSYHPDLVTALCCLGDIFYAQGELEKAYDVYGQAHDRLLDTGEHDPAQSGTCFDKLADVLADLGRFDAACMQYGMAIGDARHHLGGNHPVVAERLRKLSQVLLECEQIGRARDAATEAVAIAEAGRGPDHPGLVRSLCSLGRVHASSGDLSAAKSCYQRAFNIAQTAFLSMHPDQVESLVGLVCVTELAGDSVTAHELFVKLRPWMIHLFTAGMLHGFTANVIHDFTAECTTHHQEARLDLINQWHQVDCV